MTPRVGAWRLGAALLLSWLAACADETAPGTGCATRADCPVGYACEDGRCVGEPRCVSDASCCPGSSCVEGVCRRFVACRDTCSERDTVCVDGVCLAAPCGDDAPCSRPDRQCIAGRCLAVPACGGCAAGTVCEPLTGRCLETSTACFNAACPQGSLALITNGADMLTLTCDRGAAACACVPLPPLAPPSIGGYLDAVANASGTWLVGQDLRYGDLVVAREGTVPVSVAGVPAGPVVGALSGPRGGVAAPGPDVGRFAAAALQGDELVVLSHDLDAGAPALTRVRPDGSASTQTLPSGGATAGLGGDLTALPDGRLVAAYYSQRGDGGFEVLVARSTGASSGWSTDTLTAEGPSLPAECSPVCGALQACLVTLAAPECALPDLGATCAPGCDLSALCAGGVCSRLAQPKSRAFIDRPGGAVRVAPYGGDVALAALDLRDGTLDLWLPSGGALTRQALEGQEGKSFGAGLALATFGEEVALAYEDESVDGVVVRVGRPADGVVVQPLSGQGGRAPALLYDGNNRLLALWGGTEARGLVLATRSAGGVWSTTTLSETPLSGRSNALVANAVTGAVSAWTLADTLADSPSGARLVTRLQTFPVP